MSRHSSPTSHETPINDPERALASEDAAASFVRHGDMERARPLLDQSIAIYERLDADRDMARAEAMLPAATVQTTLPRAASPIERQPLKRPPSR
jgi:hypothetical protein